MGKSCLVPSFLKKIGRVVNYSVGLWYTMERNLPRFGETGDTDARALGRSGFE